MATALPKVDSGNNNNNHTSTNGQPGALVADTDPHQQKLMQTLSATGVNDKGRQAISDMLTEMSTLTKSAQIAAALKEVAFYFNINIISGRDFSGKLVTKLLQYTREAGAAQEVCNYISPTPLTQDPKKKRKNNNENK